MAAKLKRHFVCKRHKKQKPTRQCPDQDTSRTAFLLPGPPPATPARQRLVLPSSLPSCAKFSHCNLLNHFGQTTQTEGEIRQEGPAKRVAVVVCAICNW